MNHSIVVNGVLRRAALGAMAVASVLGLAWCVAKVEMDNVATADDAVPVADDAVPVKPRQLFENEDSTNFFYYHDIPAGKAGELIDRYVDVLAEAGVTVALWNTNARRTNYRSDVWQAFWDGYDPDGPDDQPFLAPIAADQRKRWRKLVGNMLEVHRQGIDFPARAIEHSRQRGISPWITLRMNDVHYNDNLDHPFHSPLWRKPEMIRQGATGYFARALDYAHSEVRDHYRALIVETLDRYDVDGLELDFMREPYLFSTGKEAEGGLLLTAWLRDIRGLVDAAAKRRGHAVRLSVRVPSSPQAALGLGFDVPGWVEDRLVDMVVVTPRFATLEFDMPLGRWRELLGDRVTLAGGLEVLYQPGPSLPARAVTPEEANGAAAAILAGGADAVYLFNYFQDGHPGWPLPKYESTLRAFGSLEDVAKLPRRHVVTYRDVLAPGEAYQAPLPASGTELTFTLPLGPTPAAGWQAEATIELAEGSGAAVPEVRVNGVGGSLRADEPLSGGNRQLRYTIPLTALSGSGRDTITLRVGEKITVLRVEIGLGPGG